MPSEAIVSRIKSGTAVSQAAETHAPAIAEKLAALFEPYLEEKEKLPDFGLVLKLSARRLRHSLARIEQADKNHETELADDAGFRAQRDDAYAALRGRMVKTRAIIETGFGEAGLNVFKLNGAVPTDDQKLVTTARAVADALHAKNIPTPPLTGEGIAIDRKALYTALEPLIDPLKVAIEHVKREKLEADATRVKKNEAIDEHDELFTPTSALISSALALGGEKELAERVRPSERTRGRTIEDEGDDEKAPAAPPAGAPAPAAGAPAPR